MTQRGHNLVRPVLTLALCAALLGFLVHLNSDGSQASVVLKASPSSVTYFSPNFLGFNTDPNAPFFLSPSFAPAVAGLNPSTLRVFGGTWADYIDWRTGTYYETSSHSWIQEGGPVPPMPLSVYVTAFKNLRAAGASPVPLFNLNIMTYCNPDVTSAGGVASCYQPPSANHSVYRSSALGTCSNPLQDSDAYNNWGLANQIAMLRAAQAGGMPVKYLELGNELYLGGDEVNYFPCPQDYVNKANVWIRALKVAFPNAQIGVVGIDRSLVTADPKDQRFGQWNQAVLDGVRGEDAVTFHTYFSSALGKGGSVNDPKQLATMLSTAADEPARTTLAEVNALPTRLHAWITEWNLEDSDALFAGSWAQALVQATYALDLARDPRVTLTDIHELDNNGQYWAALFNSPRYVAGSEEAPSPLPTVQPFGKTATGYFETLMQRSMVISTRTMVIHLAGGSGSGSGSVQGQAFISDGKRNLVFVNPASRTVEVELGNLSGRYEMLQYATSPNLFIRGNDSIPPEFGFTTTTVTLRPYSLTSLTATTD